MGQATKLGGRLAVALAVVSGASACAAEPGYRTLHEVDGQVVASRPPPPAAYDAYLRARLALEHDPPQLDLAEHYIDRALRYDPRDPHLWTTKAEIDAERGQLEQAAASARRALELRPGYPPAQKVLVKVEGGAASASTGADPPQP